MNKKIIYCTTLLFIFLYINIFLVDESYSNQTYYKKNVTIDNCYIEEGRAYILSAFINGSHEKIYFSIPVDFFDNFCRSGKIRSGHNYEVTYYPETYESEDEEMVTILVPVEFNSLETKNTSYEWVCSGCGKSVSSPSKPISRTNECPNPHFSSHEWSNVGQSGNISFYCKLCGASVSTQGDPKSSTCRGGGQTSYHRWSRN